ncbi:type 1 glutamine amidotransferase [Edaphobacter paludis]|uniref:Type 1 glutamine amidotransferase n=1 Tax=Edaphobacter paludis TaxID=3035702 RepID=A0AAU7DCI5_9BACT
MSILGKEESGKLKGKRVAIVATEGFEQVELTKPKKALEDAGAQVDVIAPKAGIKSGKIKGWDMTDWGESVKVDVELSEAKEGSYDALLLPGGVMSPDKLRMDPQAVAFIKSFFTANKPVAAICHGSWTLIEADVVRGKTLTSWPSLQTDLRNAGAKWVDQEVVEDNGLVTSRKPDDLPAFNKTVIELFSRATQHAAA